MINLILILFFISSSKGLIGYDCGSKYLNVTTLSLLDVGECDIPEDDIKISKKYVQLLQLNDFTSVPVFQCKIIVHRTIYYCGMHSHTSIVQNGETEYINEISQHACETAHLFGTLKYDNNHIINGLKVNYTTTHSLTFAGSLTTDGSCKGVIYSDPYGTWDNVVVQGTLKITLKTHIAKVSLSSNKIHLESGLTCYLTEGSCTDLEDGYTYWKPIPKDKCKFDHYSILYEGYANKMSDNNERETQTVYSLTANDITFALTAKSKENLCGYTIIQTEHPKLFIFETSKGESFTSRDATLVTNLDIFAYVNSKFVYVEKHIKTQMKQLYRDVITQRCRIERETLKNSLTIATQAPDEFAYRLMKGPGYMAVLAGEVVHIIKCIPVEVKIQHGKYCYAELQVSKENVTYFLTPRTHVLKTIGTQINCNTLLPSFYQVGENWYKIMPRPIATENPIIIKLLTNPTWTYINPANLAISGIYTEKDLEQLRERIMFPVERHALLNDMAREMNGQRITDTDGVISKLLTEHTIENIANSAWKNFWNKFLTFGTVSAGVIAIFTTLHGIKLILNIFIRGYTLHTIFGWSFHLLGAFLGSLSQLLITKKTKQNRQPSDPEANIEPENVNEYTPY